MFEVRCFDKKTERIFIRKFNDRKECNKFVTKCKYSKVVQVLAVIDNTKYCD